MTVDEIKREPPRPIKILIGIPNQGDLKIETAINLVFLTHLLATKPVVTVDGEKRLLMWNILEVRTSILPQSRQQLVDTAISNELDYLLFLDSDMEFDPEFIFSWVKENRPVIAMNCPTRSMPCYPTARIPSAREPFKGELVYSDIATTRWQKVWRVGTGIMLIRLDALKALPRPAFTPRWEPGNDHYAGEDWVMVEHLEAAGIPVVIDNKHSVTVRHVGAMAYSHEMIVGTRKRIASQSCIIAPDASVHIAQ